MKTRDHKKLRFINHAWNHIEMVIFQKLRALSYLFVIIVSFLVSMVFFYKNMIHEFIPYVAFFFIFIGIINLFINRSLNISHQLKTVIYISYMSFFLISLLSLVFINQFDYPYFLLLIVSYTIVLMLTFDDVKSSLILSHLYLITLTILLLFYVETLTPLWIICIVHFSIYLLFSIVPLAQNASLIELQRKNEINIKKIQEIREQREQYFQSANLIEVEDMLSSMSVEIKKNIFQISDILSLWQSSQKVTQEQGDELAGAVERISNTIRWPSEVSKIDQKEEIEHLSLSQIFDEVFVSVSYKMNKYQILTKIDGNIRLLFVDGKKSHLIQILINLFSNAIDAIKDLEKQDRWIRIKVKNFCEIHIENGGPGIPKEIKDKIFSPFFSTKALGQGSGLGLSIAKKMARLNHGDLELVEGTMNPCFCLKLKIVDKEKNDIN